MEKKNNIFKSKNLSSTNKSLLTTGPFCNSGSEVNSQPH